MNIEQKAKAYDEAIKVANKYKDTHIMFPQIKEEMFPEFKESKDEQIRKALIKSFEIHDLKALIIPGFSAKDVITWLEKQGDIIENNMLLPFKEYDNLMDSINKKKKEGYEAGYKQGLIDSKNDQHVQPKFKVGNKIHRKTPSSFDNDMEVARIDKDYYVCNHIGKFSSEVVNFSEEDNYELVEQKPTDEEMKTILRTEYEKGRADAIAEVQKPTWSEEDEDKFQTLLEIVADAETVHCIGGGFIHIKDSYKKELSDFLNSIKERAQPQSLGVG